VIDSFGQSVHIMKVTLHTVSPGVPYRNKGVLSDDLPEEAFSYACASANPDHFTFHNWI